jgi:hypothetical protein
MGRDARSYPEVSPIPEPFVLGNRMLFFFDSQPFSCSRGSHPGNCALKAHEAADQGVVLRMGGVAVLLFENSIKPPVRVQGILLRHVNFEIGAPEAGAANHQQEGWDRFPAVGKVLETRQHKFGTGKFLKIVMWGGHGAREQEIRLNRFGCKLQDAGF